MTYPIRYLRKVRYSDTDCQGHVFNANYFVYFDDAITDCFEALGLGVAELAARGHLLVVVRAECDFRSSAEVGETLVTEVAVARLGTTSVTFALRITEQKTGRLLAEGREVYVVLDRATGRPTAVPPYLADAVAALDAPGGVTGSP